MTPSFTHSPLGVISELSIWFSISRISYVTVFSFSSSGGVRRGGYIVFLPILRLSTGDAKHSGLASDNCGCWRIRLKNASRAVASFSGLYPSAVRSLAIVPPVPRTNTLCESSPGRGDRQRAACGVVVIAQWGE